MISISISDEIRTKCPDLHILAIQCKVKNSLSDSELWKEFDNEIISVRERFPDISMVNKWNTIRATREAYKKCGKDPNRYRPSAESLIRRILKDLSLYKVDTLVDLINLVSVHTGYSIGGFDVNKIDGNNLELGIGRCGEEYHGIGRGELNIEGLPVYRDRKGGIGTPTSDEERTKLSLESEELLMVINGYSGKDGLEDSKDFAIDLLKKYAQGEAIEWAIIS